MFCCTPPSRSESSAGLVLRLRGGSLGDEEPEVFLEFSPIEGALATLKKKSQKQVLFLLQGIYRGFSDTSLVDTQDSEVFLMKEFPAQ